MSTDEIIAIIKSELTLECELSYLTGGLSVTRVLTEQNIINIADKIFAIQNDLFGDEINHLPTSIKEAIEICGSEKHQSELMSLPDLTSEDLKQLRTREDRKS